MVSNQGAQRFSVRHLPHSLRLDHSNAAFVAVWRQADSRPEVLERRTADSRRRTTGPQGQARHPNDGRGADNRLSRHINFAVGQADECLRLDGRDSHLAIRRDRVCRRLLQDGEAAQSRPYRQAKVAGAVGNRNWRLDGAVYFDQVFRQRLLVERQHSVYQSHRESHRNQFHRTVSLSVLYHHCLTGILKRGEFDRRFGRPGYKRDLHRDDSFNSSDLPKQ